MAKEKRLIEELREMAERTPPICQYDKPYNTEIFGKEITVYCKPFEQFQELLRRAADALSVDAVEVEKYKRLVEMYHHLRENFIDYVCSGVRNEAPYCLNKCEYCVDRHGWCKVERCQGFNPAEVILDEERKNDEN